MTDRKAGAVAWAAGYEMKDEPMARPGGIIFFLSAIGSPDMLEQALSGIKPGGHWAIVMLVDIRKGFSGILRQRLSSATGLTVLELTENQILKPGIVYILPMQFMMDMAEHWPGGPVEAVVKLIDNQTESSGRAKNTIIKGTEIFGSATWLVILSSLSDDSLDSAKKVKEAEGKVLVQDEATSIIFDGPASIAEQNLADNSLPLWIIGSHLQECLEEL